MRRERSMIGGPRPESYVERVQGRSRKHRRDPGEGRKNQRKRRVKRDGDGSTSTTNSIRARVGWTPRICQHATGGDEEQGEGATRRC